MWRKPRLVTNVFAETCVSLFSDVDTHMQKYPFVSEDEVFARGHKYLETVVHELLLIIEACKQNVRNGMQTNEAERQYYHNIAQLFSGVPEYFADNVNELNILIQIAHITLGQTESGTYENTLGNVLMLYFATIRILIGNEKQFLLGKNRSTGQLIYKKYKTRLNTADDIFDVLRKLVGYSIDMCTVSESAIDFYPDPRDINLWVQNSHILEQEPNSDILIESRKFLEDAYYNQRYLVHERGVRVRLSGYGAIVELQLLVLPTFDDYLQFQVFLVDSSGKKATYFINEEAFLTDTDLDDEIKLGSNDSNIFKNVVFLICSVYHDLVTADTIVVEPSTDHEPKSGQPYSDSDSSEHFLYIRRTYVDKAGRQQEVEPRKPILNAITREPHHVTGHLRRLPDGKNMSAKHRIELEEFEKTTGLRVIRYIKPGFTFVRPHISPSIEGYYKLPRFIKARMQRDIRTMIEKAETDKE